MYVNCVYTRIYMNNSMEEKGHLSFTVLRIKDLSPPIHIN